MSTRPEENGHCACENNLMPEAEQTDHDISENSAETLPQEASEGNEEADSMRCCDEFPERNPEGIGDDRNEGTKDDCPSGGSAENEISEGQERECCEGQ